MTSKTRSAERIQILGELKGEIMVFGPLSVKAIGPKGATIETQFPLHLNSLHDLRLTLSLTPVVVKARVVHSHISQVDQDTVAYLSGMEFVELPQHVVVALEEFLEGMKASRSGRGET